MEVEKHLVSTTAKTGLPAAAEQHEAWSLLAKGRGIANRHSVCVRAPVS